METKQDEIRFTTSDPKEMLGKYLPNRVVKKWTEDFVDEDTSEVVSVERNELLFERGTLITQDVLAQINFAIAAGDITEVEVSNQQRLAFEHKNTAQYPFSATAIVDGKKVKFLLYAQSIANVLEILRDYIELNFSNGFDILQVKVMDHCIILNDTLKSIDEPVKTSDFDEEGDDDEENAKDGKTKKFYQILVKILYKTHMNNDEQENEETCTFIVKTLDIDHAMNVIQLYLNTQEQEIEREHIKNHREYERKEMTLSIEKAGPYAVHYFVPKDFSLAYSIQQ